MGKYINIDMSQNTDSACSFICVCSCGFHMNNKTVFVSCNCVHIHCRCKHYSKENGENVKRCYEGRLY